MSGETAGCFIRPDFMAQNAGQSQHRAITSWAQPLWGPGAGRCAPGLLAARGQQGPSPLGAAACGCVLGPLDGWGWAFWSRELGWGAAPGRRHLPARLLLPLLLPQPTEQARPLPSCCGHPAFILLHGPRVCPGDNSVGCWPGSHSCFSCCGDVSHPLRAGTPAPGAGDCLPPSRGSLSSHTEGPRMGSGDSPSFLSATILRPSPVPPPRHWAAGTVVAGPAEAVDWMGIPQETLSPRLCPHGVMSPWGPRSRGG